MADEEINSQVELDVDNAGWLRRKLRWKPTSKGLLAEAEQKLFQSLKGKYQGKYIPVSNGQNQIWTICLNGQLQSVKTETTPDDKSSSSSHHHHHQHHHHHHHHDHSSKKSPLILIHGFGGGVGLWARNLLPLSKDRPLYAFDVLGFGRSSRPDFGHDPSEIEEEFVQSIEDWRKGVGLEKFVMLGHSFGGFLSAAYALRHPEHVEHVILVDPWGFPEKPADYQQLRRLPVWARAIARMLQPFNPLAGLRALGPLGPGLVKKFRPDLMRKFGNEEDDGSIQNIADYIYHCNAQDPSGETAFKRISIPFAWAANPMLHRIHEIQKDIPFTMIHGKDSWVDNESAYKTKSIRSDSYVGIEIIEDAGHHVYADRPKEFDEVVLKVCKMVDEGNSRSSPEKKETSL